MEIKNAGGKKLTLNDVIPDHLDVVVPVRAGLFVVEPEGMQQLVLHSAVVETALTAQRHGLPTTRTPHVRPATTDTAGFLHITNVHFFPSWWV